MVTSLADLLTRSHRAVFLGGAGVSTASGIPDFRSAAGLYTTAGGGRFPPEYLLSRTCFVRSPADFFAFYRAHLLHPDALPNPAHRALAALEERGTLAAVVTQNIDGLHHAAGSRTVLELHGSVHRNPCLDCGTVHGLDVVLAASGPPRCPRCGGPIKPDVVLYEEPLDAAVLAAAVAAVSGADCLIVGGTSLNVYPAAGLVDHYLGDRLVLINRTPTPYDRRADLILRDDIARVLPEAVAATASGAAAGRPRPGDGPAPTGAASG